LETVLGGCGIEVCWSGAGAGKISQIPAGAGGLKIGRCWAQEWTKISTRAGLQLLHTSLGIASVTMCVNVLQGGRTDKYFKLIVLTTT